MSSTDEPKNDDPHDAPDTVAPSAPNTEASAAPRPHLELVDSGPDRASGVPPSTPLDVGADTIRHDGPDGDRAEVVSTERSRKASSSGRRKSSRTVPVPFAPPHMEEVSPRGKKRNTPASPTGDPGEESWVKRARNLRGSVGSTLRSYEEELPISSREKPQVGSDGPAGLGRYWPLVLVAVLAGLVGFLLGTMADG